jgi:hypothetical protein
MIANLLYPAAILSLFFALVGGTFAQSPPPSTSSTNALAASGSTAEQQNVRSVAEGWLATIDQGKTTEAFRALSASRSSASALDESRWQAIVAAKRAELGQPQGRRFKNLHLYRKGENGEERDFYLMEFRAVSKETSRLRELVQVFRDPDGTWRVAGYTIEQGHHGGDQDEKED